MIQKHRWVRVRHFLVAGVFIAASVGLPSAVAYAVTAPDPGAGAAPTSKYDQLPSDVQRAQVWTELKLLLDGKCAPRSDGSSIPARGGGAGVPAASITNDNMSAGKWWTSDQPAGYHVNPSAGEVDCNNGDNWFSNLVSVAGYPSMTAFGQKVLTQTTSGNWSGMNAKTAGAQLAADIFGTRTPSIPSWMGYFIAYYHLFSNATCQANTSTTPTANSKTIQTYDQATKKVTPTYVTYSNGTKKFSIGFGVGLEDAKGQATCDEMANYLKATAPATAMLAWATYGAAVGIAGAGATIDANSTSGSPTITCESSYHNVLNWVFCPIIDGASEAAQKLDGYINELLTIDAQHYFNNGSSATDASCNTTNPAGCYYSAWAAFRNISIAILLAAGLFMVVSQMAGISFLDAYTIRKVLPRLLIAVVAITLSWQLVTLAIQMSNSLGKAVASIIYTPFSRLGNVSVGFGVGTLVGLGTAAWAISLGILASLSLVLTAAMSAFIGFALLIFRQIAIIFLAVLSPVAIALYILPGTEKIYKLWWESFSKGLMMFPLLMGFIAIGRVFSQVSSQSGEPLANVIALIAYFAPYFLIPTAFKMAGGFIGRIAGITNDRGRGAFDKLKKYRQHEQGERGKRWKQGNLWNPESKATKFLRVGTGINRVGAHAGAMAGPHGWQMGFGKAGQAKMSNNAFSKYDAYAQQDKNFKDQVDNEDGMIAHAYGNNASKLASLKWFQNADGSANQAKIDSAIAASQSIQMTGQSRTAAFDAVMASGKIFAAGKEGREEMQGLISTMSGSSYETQADGSSKWVGGNAMMANALHGNMMWRARSSGGRQDLGRANSVAVMDETSLSTWGQQKPYGSEGLQKDSKEALDIHEATIANLEPGYQNNTLSEADQKKYLEAQNQKAHIIDVLYSGQDLAYTSPYQQHDLKTAWSKIDPRLQDDARQKALLKMQGGGVPAAPGAFGMPPGMGPVQMMPGVPQQIQQQGPIPGVPPPPLPGPQFMFPGGPASPIPPAPGNIPPTPSQPPSGPTPPTNPPGPQP